MDARVVATGAVVRRLTAHKAFFGDGSGYCLQHLVAGGCLPAPVRGGGATA
ncbi:uncharacterized protein DS421_6g191710 [Arachis hypogaea]|nr:uncharacterized protein DS421_6g191710 [Arachis hypogaea]